MTNKKDSQDNSLSGFEEVFDLYEEDLKKKNKSERYNNPHELLNFLENENERLQRLDIFFSDKIPNLINHPTTANLCTLQKQNISDIKDELWFELRKPQSIFLKNLGLLFDKAFGANLKSKE